MQDAQSTEFKKRQYGYFPVLFQLTFLVSARYFLKTAFLFSTQNRKLFFMCII